MTIDYHYVSVGRAHMSSPRTEEQNMANLPIITELLDPTDDYRKLRRVAAPLIEHSDILSMPMEVIAEQLVKKCNAEGIVFENGGARVSLEDTVFRMCPETAYEIWAWFGVVATPAERVACCLVALGKARMKK